MASPARSADVSNFRIRSAGGQVWVRGGRYARYGVNVRISNGHEGPRRRSVGERCQVEAGGIDVSGYHGSSSNQRVSPDAWRLALLSIPAGPESDSGRRVLADVCSVQVRKLEPGSEAVPHSMSNSGRVLSASLRRRRRSEAQPRIGSGVKIGTLSLDQGKVCLATPSADSEVQNRDARRLLQRGGGRESRGNLFLIVPHTRSPRSSRLLLGRGQWGDPDNSEFF
ncbi:hypothetical protein R1flu_004055 [Riccia fluitans]|uniref:Ribosomal protein L2 n=1 Tax=Riccia fluitans TaxID=41844 RepID=A0ABD1YP72_9MARC